METLHEGSNKCPYCNKTFIASYAKYPANDIRHEVECPYCKTTLCFTEGTEEISTYKTPSEDIYIPLCPKCRKPMVARFNYSGTLFWGCSDFPYCTGTRS